MPYKDPEIGKKKKQEYYLKNKERIQEYRKNTQNHINEYARQYRAKNKEIINAQNRKRYSIPEIHEKKLESRREYDEKNRPIIIQQKQLWKLQNKEKYQSYYKFRFRFKNRYIKLDYNPREGICFFCKFEADTLLHHFEYDDNDPLRWTIELCRACHKKWHDKYGVPDGYVNPNHFKGK